MAQNDFLIDLYVANSASSAPGTIDLHASAGDLITVSGTENLIQALRLRILTPLGELERLGHPDYGSRLFMLIGRLPGPEVNALATAYMREAIRREPRVASILRLEVGSLPGSPESLLIETELLANGLFAPVQLSTTIKLSTGHIEVKPNGV
ncbi:hypothetical protein ACFPVX_22870 [Cohnella faecalis]|uniref:DUF2634 domain-containing protein n=1 Tax=Cohnella faecalis TaxID=2315694 RepID=A0A398CGV5_9BACL|nr:hypothetical protein [Cohnella faecalis]RIE02436.1 hypothetical protein D3H35_17175 [Cohnella faecalis]